MLDLTWKMFSYTGDIHLYLLFKEFEKENQDDEEEVLEADYPLM